MNLLLYMWSFHKMQDCPQFWPDEGTETYGPFSVSLMEKESTTDFQIRELKLVYTKRVSYFTQSLCHCTYKTNLNSFLICCIWNQNRIIFTFMRSNFLHTFMFYFNTVLFGFEGIFFVTSDDFTCNSGRRLIFPLFECLFWMQEGGRCIFVICGDRNFVSSFSLYIIFLWHLVSSEKVKLWVETCTVAQHVLFYMYFWHL